MHSSVARLARSVPQNTPGDLFVDDSCIDQARGRAAAADQIDVLPALHLRAATSSTLWRNRAFGQAAVSSLSDRTSCGMFGQIS